MAFFLGSSRGLFQKRGLFQWSWSTVLGLSTAAVTTISTSHHQRLVARLDYWQHEPADFDVYIRNPTAEDLPRLLKKFKKGWRSGRGFGHIPTPVDHSEWSNCKQVLLAYHCYYSTHFRILVNESYVFVGCSEETIEQIIQIRAASPNHNILVIADQATIDRATARHPPGILADCHCGLVTDVGNSVALWNAEAKLIMLQDERVIAYDRVTFVNAA